MKRLLVFVLGAVLLAVAGAAASIAIGGNKPGPPKTNAHNKVTICHATGSKKNPYVRITPDAAGVVSGHAGHQDKRDIIPPFDYYDASGSLQHFPGLNWDEKGQAIYMNGCRIPAPGSTTTVPTPTTPPIVSTVTVTTTVPSTTAGTTTVTITQPPKVIKKIITKKVVRVVGHRSPKATG